MSHEKTPTQLSVFAALVFLAGLLLYLPGLSGPLFFDDMPALTGNTQVQIPGTVFDGWRAAALSSDSGPLRRPLAMLSFAANHAAEGGFTPWGLKAVNLAIHLGMAILLFYFFQAVIRALGLVPDAFTIRLLALTGSAIWLLHPLNVSTVLYAVQRMAQLSALFVLAGLLVFMWYRQRWAERGAPAGEIIAAALWVFFLALLATLSKENGALLPWLAIVLEVCIFRGRWAGRSHTGLRMAGWVLLFAPVVLVMAILAISPDILVGGYSGREFSLEERLLTQARLLWRYLGWICLPNINDMGFQHDDIPLSTGLFSPFTTVLALGAWLLVLVVAFLLRRRFPLLLLALLFFLVGQSMESSVIPLEMVYEHRNYLPDVLLCLALATVLVIPATRSKRLNVWYPVTGVLAVLCLLLFIRVQAWSDELTLSRVNLASHPESARSHFFYANALFKDYRRMEESGAAESEKTETLLLSRHYFERMYQTDNQDVAALVMLFYLDSQYFTQHPEQVDWLAKIEELLTTRKLQRSDWNALALLFELLSANPGYANETRVTGLLDALSARYPWSVDVLRYRYEYLLAIGAGPNERLPLLERAQSMAPGQNWPYHALLREMARGQDPAGIYEYARLWLLFDPQRYDIHELKSLFGGAEPAAEPLDKSRAEPPAEASP